MEQDTATGTSTRSALKIGIAGAFLVMAGFAFFWPRPSATPASQQATVQPTPKQIHTKFVDLAKQYHTVAADRKETVKTALRNQATKRQQAMAKLMRQDVAAYLALAMNQNDRELLPTDVQALVEEDVEVTGTLGVNHADNFETKTSTDEYVLTNDASTDQTQLFFAAEPTTDKRGATVKIKGSKLLDTVAVPDTTESVQVVQPAVAATATTGQKRVVVILFNFSADPNNQPHSPATVTQQMFTNPQSGKNFYATTSGNQLDLVGEVYGWYTINAAPTGCNQTTWADLAGPLAPPAAQTGVDYYVFVNPFISGCPAGVTGQYQYNGVSTALINGWHTSVTVHELGHLFGVGHANTLDCYDPSGNRVPISTNCTSKEYGDQFDVMGGLQMRHFNNPHTINLGWYSPDNIQTITASGDYTLYPIEATTFGQQVRALRVANRFTMRSSLTPAAPAVVSDGYYYLEYRRPFSPYDAFPETDRVVNGLSIRASTASKSHLLDMTPETLNFPPINPLITYDQALLPGQTFTDAARGLTVTVTIAPDKLTAVAHVTLTCVNQRPTISIAGSNNFYLKAGQTIDRTVTIRNNDYAECGSSAFVLTPNLPSGWTQAAVPPLTLAPGEETTVTVSITPAPTTVDGNYTFSETVSNQAVPTANATSNAPTVIYDGTAPQVLIHTPTANSYIPLTGSVTISMEVVDTVSYPKVGTISIDGQIQKSCQFLQMFFCQYTWPVDGLSDGVHTIDAVGTDWAGNETRTTIRVYYPSGGGEVTPGEIEG